MAQEGLRMQGGNSHIQEEMREVEEELEEDSSTHDASNPRGRSIPLEALEEGKNDHVTIPSSPSRHNGISSATSRSSSPRPGRHGPSISFPLSQKREKVHWTVGIKERIRQTLQVMTSPVFAQAFVLTFLGEWGDRSQITTIAMAGAHVSLRECGRRRWRKGS
jgi:putative Ca2+/H+ antiporter (TMEM165/GDT1 family)